MVQNWTRGAAPRLSSYPQGRHLDNFDQRRSYDLLEGTRHQPPMVRTMTQDGRDGIYGAVSANGLEHQAIDTALRTHCGIWARQYFVAVILDDGTPATFFSPGQKLQDHVVSQFFDANKFQQAVSQANPGQCFMPFACSRLKTFRANVYLKLPTKALTQHQKPILLAMFAPSMTTDTRYQLAIRCPA